MLLPSATQDEKHELQALAQGSTQPREPHATCSPLRCRVAVARQDPSGAADALSKGIIERDTATLPSMRPALPVHPPLGGPSEIGFDPDQPPDPGGPPAER